MSTTNRQDAVAERITAQRGREIAVVGVAGGERVNLDIATPDDIMCSELTRDEARLLRDALTVFLGDPGMSAEELRTHADELAELRDKAMEDARRSVSDGARELNVGRAAGLRQALAYLHIQSNGRFGARSGDQPNPFDIPLAQGGAR